MQAGLVILLQHSVDLLTLIPDDSRIFSGLQSKLFQMTHTQDLMHAIGLACETSLKVFNGHILHRYDKGECGLTSQILPASAEPEGCCWATRSLEA